MATRQHREDPAPPPEPDDVPTEIPPEEDEPAEEKKSGNPLDDPENPLHHLRDK